MSRALLFVAFLLMTPVTTAQSAGGSIDATVTLDPGASPVIDAPLGLIRIENSTPGERYEFNLTLTKGYTTFEVRAHGFQIERPRQIVPSLALDPSEYPLFFDFPNEAIWDVDAPARVFFTNGTAQDVALRLGVPGPANVTLVIERDVTPPTYTLGKVQNITHYSFYQEATTDELALGDLQQRAVGATDWVVNPTPVLHFRQRFPVQGLLPEREYEVRAIFTDWAENVAVSEIYRVTSAAAPILPTPIVTPVSPVPNSTINSTFVTLRARVESPESALLPNALTVFFDKRPITAGIRFENDELVYTPPEPLAPGRHTFAVEVYNEAGGKGEAHWSFEVAAPDRETPLVALVATVGLLAAAWMRRRT